MDAKPESSEEASSSNGIYASRDEQNSHMAKIREKWSWFLPDEVEDEEGDAENFEGAVQGKYSVEDTCHSMKFLGLAIEEDDISSYYPWGDGLKVGAIDHGVGVGVKQHMFETTEMPMMYDN